MKPKILTTCFVVLCLVMVLPIVSFGVGGEGQVELLSNQPVENGAAVEPETIVPRKRFLSKWLHLLDGEEEGELHKSSVLAFAPKVPGDLARVINIAGGEKGFRGVFLVLIKVFAALVLGGLVNYLLKKMFKVRLQAVRHLAPPDGKGASKFVAGLLRSLPEYASLFLFAVVATLIFLLLAQGMSIEGRMIYQLILGIIVMYRVFHLLGVLIFSPHDKSVRLANLNDSLVKPLYLAFTIILTVLGSVLLLGYCCKELGARPQTVSWIAIVLGTVVLLIVAGVVLFLRKPVSDYLLKGSQAGPVSWMQQQGALFWHLPALLYIAIVWFIWVGQETTGTVMRNGSFVVSVLVVPLYFVLSYFARILIEAVVVSLELGKLGARDDNDEDEFPEEEAIDKNSIISKRVHSVFRFFLIFLLFAWVCSLWGYNFPFATQAMKALFESLVTVALALVCWRYASTYIEAKMVDTVAEVSPEQQDIDDEFGGASPRGRSHTLLPLVRKVIGSTLVVMVGLIVVSSLGVNIGPLLAGAGVLGLAVGFGAQKLVSDILSGFFFLLDDAFRVGEYIQAGKIKGTVESITLRNVLLRHHLGMLQVVPHSDLGAVTNYMRGGIVIKFPLEFPYDTDIDKVRKIIKKVGQEMLVDEELGDGFIQPLKSQGVNEITNSVMVIRVKFTAKPGKQFLIKREAFRRITEALGAKDIHYAHRKVIVDFPSDSTDLAYDQQLKRKALEAGAASVVIEESLAPKEEEPKE
ncbi:mechanosensitive ion channel family protein [Desulforhopalus sp. IMCC35007]|uniref:mechanosensitive ion channel family protein n=1 Tax=Desulforhopalus sp. IMCC35007 TaxID=2569543 RepID=UPI0010AE3898|nr:mechanosensitive ion channel family protein [Desulforhopalus sp. IMCC35007]TKB12398.1 mechanosensitive ion channel family protein [Desulforhopalus sp. IMCC35007]